MGATGILIPEKSITAKKRHGGIERTASLEDSARPAVTGSEKGDPGMVLTREKIEKYLGKLGTAGHSSGTVESYRRFLNHFFLFLPEDKHVQADTLVAWQKKLLESGYAAKTVNVGTAAVNGLMVYCGYKGFQADRLPEKKNVQPELTRTEYLRLLSAAKLQGNRKKYLLAKVFGSTGLSVGELEKLTVETVKAGKLSFPKHTLRIPAALRQELLDYIKGEGISSGPIFVTKAGMPVDRTSVTNLIQTLSTDAQVPEEKANPRCLKKLYQATVTGIQENYAVLMEQAYDRLLEKEQNIIGWKE